MEIGLGPGHIVLDGDPAPHPPQKGHSLQFLAYVYCGQMVTHHSYWALVYKLDAQSTEGKITANNKNLIIPEKWNSSAVTYAQYAIARTSNGSTTVNANMATDSVQTFH